jgi:glycine betaine/proline transport system ATP-binding protein
MQDELIHLQKIMHKTILFITHDFLEALKLGDHIAIMKGGEIVQMGTPEDVVMRPVNDYVREFTKDVPRSRVLTAKSIMQPASVIVSENDTLDAVMPLLKGNNSTVAFVQGENGRFLGTLCVDQIDGSPSTNSTVRSLIKQDYPTATSDTTLADLIPFVAATHTPVPVVDDEQALLGTIDQVSVMLALGGAEDVVDDPAANQLDDGQMNGATD